MLPFFSALLLSGGGDRPSGWLCQHYLPRRTFYCDQFSDVMCDRYQAELDLYLDV